MLSDELTCSLLLIGQIVVNLCDALEAMSTPSTCQDGKFMISLSQFLQIIIDLLGSLTFLVYR